QDSVDLDWNEIDVGQLEGMAPEARPSFSFAVQRARRKRRALIASVGFALIMSGFLVSMMGPRHAFAIGVCMVLLVIAAWWKHR
ncbi:MAG: hypothetical protein ACOVP8_02225, partial [Phycisphaerales bacterium]